MDNPCVKLTLSQWCEFCDFLQQYPVYRDHVKTSILDFECRDASTYTCTDDRYVDYPVYNIEFTLNMVYTHYVMATNYARSI